MPHSCCAFYTCNATRPRVAERKPPDDRRLTQDSIQGKTLAAGDGREDRLLGIPGPATERQREASHPRRDLRQGHAQRQSLSRDARAGRKAKPLAQGEQEAARSRW